MKLGTTVLCAWFLWAPSGTGGWRLVQAFVKGADCERAQAIEWQRGFRCLPEKTPPMYLGRSDLLIQK
jgi:hypothetical protein